MDASTAATGVVARQHASWCVITASKWYSNQTQSWFVRCTTSGNARQRSQCESNGALHTFH